MFPPSPAFARLRQLLQRRLNDWNTI